MRDRSQIKKKVVGVADRFGSKNSQQYKQILLLCEKSEEAEVFYGLFAFFYNQHLQENKFERQQLAGKLLMSVVPNPALDLEASIYAAALVWEYSIEELPWYWCKVFGLENVVNFINGLLPSVANQELERSLKTMLFWCRGYGK